MDKVEIFILRDGLPGQPAEYEYIIIEGPDIRRQRLPAGRVTGMVEERQRNPRFSVTGMTRDKTPLDALTELVVLAVKWDG